MEYVIAELRNQGLIGCAENGMSTFHRYSDIAYRGLFSADTRKKSIHAIWYLVLISFYQYLRHIQTGLPGEVRNILCELSNNREGN